MAMSFGIWDSLRNLFRVDLTLNRRLDFEKPSPPPRLCASQTDRRTHSISPRSRPTSRDTSRDQNTRTSTYLPTPPSTGFTCHRYQTPTVAPRGAMANGQKHTPQRDLFGGRGGSSSIRGSSDTTPKISDKFGSSPSWKVNVDANGATHIATLERANPDRGFRCDYYEELRFSQNKVVELQQAGWPKDATYLFHKISMRGYEPLMPHNWIIDFDTVPLSLFTDQHRGAFIKADRGSDFRAIHALKNFISIGCRTRDAVRTEHSPEKILHRGIVDYVRWAFRDSNLSFTATIPNLLIDSNPVDRPATELEARMLKRLEALAVRWDMNLRIYDSVEASEAGSIPPSVQSMVSFSDILSDASDEDSADDISNAVYNARYASRRSRRPVPPQSSGSSTSSAASFEPGSSIDNTISSYSYSSNGTSNSTNGIHSPSSSVTMPAVPRYTHHLPTLYGIIISHTVVAVVAYDPNSLTTYSSLSPTQPTATLKPTTTTNTTLVSLPHSPTSLVPPCLRTISFFDFGAERYDVWNALALAIVVVHCRNALLELVHDGVDVEDVGKVEGVDARDVEDEAESEEGVGEEEGEGVEEEMMM